MKGHRTILDEAIWKRTVESRALFLAVPEPNGPAGGGLKAGGG